MGLTAVLRRLAFGRPTAFAVIGRGGAPIWRRVVLGAPIEPVPAPHDADLMLLCGGIPDDWADDLAGLFETVALPRLAAWAPPPDGAGAPLKIPYVSLGDPPDWASVRRALLDPQADAARPLLPDEPPAPWRGLGDWGQGGEGMMGGKPYGRPMAMTADDVDDLALGDVPTALGPFFPGLPGGLGIGLRMQGQRVRTVDAVDDRRPVAAPEDPPATVAEAERRRLAARLSWAGNLVALAGLPALGRGFLAAADRASTGGGAAAAGRIDALFRRAERGRLADLISGVGRIDADTVERLGLEGPLARACGVRRDARRDDPAYRALGFEVCLETGGDAFARWRLARAECRQALDLIDRGGERALEAPAEPATPGQPALAGLLADLLPGLLWEEAVLAVASLDPAPERPEPGTAEAAA